MTIIVTKPHKDEAHSLKNAPASSGISSPISSYLLLGIFLLLLVYAFVFARAVFIPVVLSFFLYMVLRPLTRILERVHIPKTLGAILILMSVLGIIGFASLQLVAPAREWISTSPQRLNKIEKKVQDLLKPIDQLRQIADEIGKIAAKEDPKTDEVRIMDPSLSNLLFAGTQTLIGYVIIILVLLYFFLSSGDYLWHGLSQLCSTKIDRDIFMRIVHNIETKLSGYLFTVLLINICEGFLIGMGMFLVGMPNPMLWGALAGLLNFIPYIGALVGEIIVTMVALSSFDDVGHALLAPLIYVTITFIEGNFITPMILGKRFTLNPVVIILAMVFWGWIWGIVGLFLAVPILVMSGIVFENIPSLASVGKFLGK